MAPPLSAKEERLTVLNKLLLPLLRAARRYHHVWRLARASDTATTPAKVSGTSTYTVALITLELPGSHPLTIAYYISAQHSRPLSPKQLTQRMRQLRRILRKSRPPAGDVVYALHAPAGLTRGARKIAHYHMLLYAQSPEKLAKRIASYLRNRYEKLLERVRGRKIWGPLPLLLYSLSTLASELGAKVPETLNPDWVIRAAERGDTVT